MNRFFFAFVCFFWVLFRGRLPDRAAALLPAVPSKEPLAKDAAPAKAAPAAPPPRPAARDGEMRSEGALALLALLQREGRFVDFLREPLDTYQDAEIGAAVRDVHRGCCKVLEDHLRIEPVLPGEEEGPVIIPVGFDPTEVRLVGEARGAPPFRGTLLHHGWRAREVRFPTLSDGVDRSVLAPAEVRVA